MGLSALVVGEPYKAAPLTFQSKKRDIKLISCHIPGVDNILVDAFSRKGTQIHASMKLSGSLIEWHLHPTVPTVWHSVFPEAQPSSCAPLYLHHKSSTSLGSDTQAIDRDALVVIWSGLLAYAYWRKCP